MGLTTDPNSPCLKKIGPDGQQACYLVLSEEERAKGFVRPVRNQYKHVGIRPKFPLRDLTPEELEQYRQFGYVKYEAYPENETCLVGRFWTLEQLRSGCGTVTTMGVALAETYARQPSFYGGTYCAGCRKHLPVGAEGEFVWVDKDGTVTDQRVGT